MTTSNKREPENLSEIENNSKPCIRTSTKIEYNGWTIPEKNYRIEEVNIKDITPQEFFTQYVTKRKPVVLKGVLSEETFQSYKLWTNEYLRKKIGCFNLQIEKRDTIQDCFGKGQKVQMTFNEFIELLEEGNEMNYLTTQDVHITEEGDPEIMATFMKNLQHDFPLQPSLTGHLIPQNINLWMGNNQNGSSSGLHHDYHDNLYIVLRGKKNFRLYSPMDTERMYTHGELEKVHFNGRINYINESTTPYGADLQTVKEFETFLEQEQIEKEITAAEEGIERGEEGAQQRLEDAELRLEQIMDKALEEATAEDFGDDDEEDENSFIEKEEIDTFELSNSNQKIEENEIPIALYNLSMPNSDLDNPTKDPVSFSRVQTTQSNEVIHKQYPEFLNASAGFCDIEQGNMLYLPASWFHEVTSYGSKSGHLALNYWFHPPDTNDFQNPYSSLIWNYKWRRMMEDLEIENDLKESENEEE